MKIKNPIDSIDDGVTFSNDEKTAGIQYSERFIFARIHFH